MRNKSYIKNLLCLTLSMTVFGTVGLLSRYLPYSSGTIALFRSVIGFIFLTLFMLAMRRRPDTEGIRSNIALLGLSGVFLGVNWIFFFEACALTTVGTATLAYYLEPIILVCLAPIFFKERITLKKLICILGAILGMVLVSGVIDGTSAGVTAQGILFGIAAAVLYACVVICNKKMKDIEPITKTVCQFLVSALVLLPYVLISGGFRNMSFAPIQLIPLLTIGILHTGVAYVLYFGSTGNLSANTLAIYSYIDPIVALVASFLVLGETMTPLMAIGAVLIVLSSVASEVSFKKKTPCDGVSGEAEPDEN
ncbi:MAG: EamA family transporter [Clostridia bacterium]|nr:EamA family transporter [Clostridia bacterium]